MDYKASSKHYLDLMKDISFDFLKREKELIDEYKKFLVLKLTFKDHDEPFTLSPSYPIDQVWHDHILVTREYDAFCKHVGNFLNHNPKTVDVDKETRYQRTLDFYKLIFNQDPPLHIWSDGLIEDKKEDKAERKKPRKKSIKKEETSDLDYLENYKYIEQYKDTNHELYKQIIDLGGKNKHALLLKEVKDTIGVEEGSIFLNELNMYIKALQFMDNKTFLELVKQDIDLIKEKNRIEKEKLNEKLSDEKKDKLIHESININYTRKKLLLLQYAKYLEHLPDENKSCVFVKNLDGSNSTYYVDLSTTTTYDLKTLVMAKKDVHADNQRYIFAGRQMNNSYMLNKYLPSKECTIHMVLNLRGC